MSKFTNKQARFIAPVILLIVTFIAVFILNSKEIKAGKSVVVGELPHVEVIELEPQRLNLDIRSNGVVASRVKARLVPEVTGKISWVDSKWHDGGFFKQGEAFFRVEKHQYENYVAKAKAQLAESKALYIQEQGMALVAKKEWEQRNQRSRKDSGKAAKSLALREPQYASAKARYEAALSDFKLAKINLKKTVVRAPFDGILQKKAADIGQFISANQALGEFYAVDFAEIRVPLTESNQHLIAIPSLQNSRSTPVKVQFKSRVSLNVYDAELVRTESVLDEVTKVLYGIVRVKDPYQIKSASGKPALRMGSYVSVMIPGRDIEGLYVLPAAVLRGGNRVYVVDDDNVLRSHIVTLQSNYDGITVVSSGLEGGVRVVAGRVGEAMEGRKVTVSIRGEEKPSTPDSVPAEEKLGAE